MRQGDHIVLCDTPPERRHPAQGRSGPTLSADVPGELSGAPPSPPFLAADRGKHGSISPAAF